jgi:PhnB protein
VLPRSICRIDERKRKPKLMDALAKGSYQNLTLVLVAQPQRASGGTIGTMLKVADSPIPVSTTHPGRHIVHANICIDGVELAGANVEAHNYQRPRGFYVLLGVDSEQKVDSHLGALQTNGRVILAPQPTF